MKLIYLHFNQLLLGIRNKIIGEFDKMMRGRERGGNFVPVKVGEEMNVKIEAVGEKGDGIARVKGFVLFIPGVKEGDEVRIRITRVLSKVGFAEAVGKASGAAGSDSEQSDEYSEDASEEKSEPAEDTEDFGDEDEPEPSNADEPEDESEDQKSDDESEESEDDERGY